MYIVLMLDIALMLDNAGYHSSLNVWIMQHTTILSHPFLTDNATYHNS